MKFNYIVGNPPYLQIQKINNNYKTLLKKQNYKVFKGTGDIYCLFYEHGINMLNNKGLLCYITSNKWMRADYGEKLRGLFAEQNPKLLIDLGPGVFKSATVDTNILLIEKNVNQNSLKALTYYSDLKSINEAMSNDSITLKKVSHDSWFIGNSAEISLKEKIERIGKPLKDWDVNIYRGVLTGLNEAFIIDTATKERLCAEDPKSAEIIKPILRGRDIKRYSYEWAGLWIIATGFDLDIPNLYPAVYNHLLKFEEKAKKRDDQGKNWWNLRACKYYNEFEKEKIVWGNIAYDNTFCLLEKGIYLNAPGNMITSKNVSLNYLLACLNSKIFNFEFKNIGNFIGKGFILTKQYIEQIHVPIITAANQHIADQMIALVEQITAIKKTNTKANTSELEGQIDRLVYQLYDLTEDEIAIIEQGINK